MAKDFFERIKRQARAKGIEGTSREAREWFRKKAREIRSTPNKILENGDKTVTSPSIGKMYFYFYDAKTKDVLPYWDKFPLTIVIERYRDGFLGLNLHYLSPKARGALFDKLMEYSSDKNLDDRTRLQLSYSLLKGAANVPEFRPTVKRYLNTQMKSRMLEIHPENWLPAVFLPVARFQKASNTKVWSSSRQKY